MCLRLRLLLALALLSPAAAGAGQPSPQADAKDAVDALITALERAALTADSVAIRALAAPDAEQSGLEHFIGTVSPPPARFVARERDRAPLEGGNQRLLVEMFIERGMEARVSTWRVDIEPHTVEGAAQPVWRIALMERLTIVAGLYRLSLDESRQFAVRNLTLRAPDLTIEMREGDAFLVETPEGPTAVVLVGRGRMRFAPPDPAEQTQIRILTNHPVLETEFEGAFIRFRPSEFETYFDPASLVPRERSASDADRARDIFFEFSGKSLHIDLGDLSRDPWSIVPAPGDLLAEIRTRKYGDLTYARTGSEAEDITVFDRRRRRNISVYASEAKLAERGRFYSEDDLVGYDVEAYDIDASFVPDRFWLEGNVRLKLRVRAPTLTSMTLRLAEDLTVRGVYSPGLGRLMHLRVVGQNSVIVNLPATLTEGAELWLIVLYGGRLEPQTLDREAVALQQDQREFTIPLEPRYIYSNRSYWYPQSTVSDYATARLKITVPAGYGVVASGEPTGPPAPAPGPVESGGRADMRFVFDAKRPVRYLAFVASRFDTIASTEIKMPASKGETSSRPGELDAGGSAEGPALATDGSENTLSLVVQSNPRQAGRARELAERTADILGFYTSLIGEAPYPSFTLAVTENELPGGHSPGYFAVLNQALPNSPVVWRSDPVSFDGYPMFFLAHELAHQWWGQAVGWKNYHEQWLSEGFAQYFAALYAGKDRGTDVLHGVFRQMRRWAIDQSSQGPVYLGYRLGHIEADGRVFRSIIYNKAAMVLHMLRRLVGDEHFFEGLRQFYREWQFKKAGTDDFRAVMEAVSGRDLTPFFEGWIYGFDIPRLRFTYQERGRQVTLRFEHKAAVMPLAVTVQLIYSDRSTEEVVVGVSERVVERTVPLRAGLREIKVNEDHAVLAEIDR